MSLIAHEQYFYQPSKDCGYFLVNGTQELVEEIAKQLTNSKYSVHNIAKSWKPNRLGKQYDWYIRINKEDGSIPHYLEFKEFARRFEIASKEDHTAEKERLAHEMIIAREQLSQLRFETDFVSAEKEDLEFKLKNIGRTLEDQIQYTRTLEEDNARLEDERNKLNAHRYSLEGRIEQLENPNLGALLSDGHDKHGVAQGGLFTQTLETIFPNITFLRDSLEQFDAWLNPKPALSTLAHITSGEEHGKPFQAAGKGWKEITKVNNGHDESGRIYFCKDADIYYVLISLKEDQEKDAKYLSKK